MTRELKNKLRTLAKEAAQPPYSLCRGVSGSEPCQCHMLWSKTDDELMLSGEDCEEADSMGEGYTREQAHKNMLFVEAALNAFMPMLNELEFFPDTIPEHSEL